MKAWFGRDPEREVVKVWFVICGRNGRRLPCSSTEIRFFDENSALAFLNILRRLGHPVSHLIVSKRRSDAS